jgi:hypothetical protein
MPVTLPGGPDGLALVLLAGWAVMSLLHVTTRPGGRRGSHRTPLVWRGVVLLGAAVLLLSATRVV